MTNQLIKGPVICNPEGHVTSLAMHASVFVSVIFPLSCTLNTGTHVRLIFLNTLVVGGKHAFDVKERMFNNRIISVY